MSYTPPEQNLPRADLDGSIHNFCRAVSARLDDYESWDSAHLQELREITRALRDVQQKLRDL